MTHDEEKKVAEIVKDFCAEIDRLQRENSALREDRYKLACAITGGEDAPGLLDSTPTSEIVEIAQHARRIHQDDIDRAMAAESEVMRLREALEPFSQFRTAKMPGRYTDAIGEYFVPSDFEKARAARASTGGEHHAE